MHHFTFIPYKERALKGAGIVLEIRAVIDIHFFFDSIIDILFFDSDYFDSILKNCTNRIFSHIPHYFCG